MEKMTNGEYVAKMLKEHHPSDEIILDGEAYKAIKGFRDKIVGDDNDNVSDVIWANTVPIDDIELRNGNMVVRVFVIQDALEKLDEVADGEVAVVGAIQNYNYKSFVIIGVAKGKNSTHISLEDFDQNGKVIGTIKNHEPFYEFMRIWHGIQIALLNPQIKDVFTTGQIVKRYTREDTKVKKRQRVVRYIKRHIINSTTLEKTLREYHRHCLAWYVVGHWRHYKDGHTVFIKPYWKGEMRALKHNFDGERKRLLAVQ